ncbi:MAG: hydrogenase maturation nickel metallochaperone HypA [Cellvibrionaceae bacterium]|nr:hydrogenase maturation nickel metallochaperone HypA [Cellvibrionaceae bacterium]
MHEMALCESLLQLIEAEAQQHGFARVTTVYLEIGELAGVELAALKFCFDVVTKKTVAHDSKLRIVVVPGASWCMPCATQVAVKQRHQPCPHCGSHQLQVVAGDEMKIKELEVV